MEEPIHDSSQGKAQQASRELTRVEADAGAVATVAAVVEVEALVAGRKDRKSVV